MHQTMLSMAQYVSTFFAFPHNLGKKNCCQS